MKQTAGRDALNEIAPLFANLNDDVLFGKVWDNDQNFSIKNRCIITVTALISKGIFDNSFKYHMQNAKNHGVSRTEMVEIITQLAFYVGWPNAWAAFNVLKEVYKDDTNEGESLFKKGEENKAYEKFFTGKSYLKPLNTKGVGIFNVTFEPKCRNNWHIHHNGGQILLCTDGYGWYQEENQKARLLKPGDVVYIAPEVKHWHGAYKDCYFTHIAIEIPSTNGSTEWLEKVSDELYNSLKKEDYE